MTFTLTKIAYWGRSYQEYIDMFNLSNISQDHTILGVGDGPASFNAIMTCMNYRVISCDPLYYLPESEIKSSISISREEVMKQVYENNDNFIWEYFKDPASLERSRLDGMDFFIQDYRKGKKEGRYLCAKLPFLPFKDNSFNLALCSHLLFLYSSLGFTFHMNAICEMIRVASEVRVYPIVDINCNIPDFRDYLIDQLKEMGYCCRYERVRYNFIRNAYQMLRILK